MPSHIMITESDRTRVRIVSTTPGPSAGEHQTSLRISDALTFIRVRPPIAGL
jgi:hypothetical protein